MALYSVWDWDRNAYRIYSTSRTASVGDDPTPPRPTGLAQLGADPDTDVKPLPAGAKLVGYSHIARGEIRRLNRGFFSDLGDDAGAGSSTSWLKLGAAAAGGALAMHLWMGAGR